MVASAEFFARNTYEHKSKEHFASTYFFKKIAQEGFIRFLRDCLLNVYISFVPHSSLFSAICTPILPFTFLAQFTLITHLLDCSYRSSGVHTKHAHFFAKMICNRILRTSVSHPVDLVKYVPIYLDHAPPPKPCHNLACFRSANTLKTNSNVKGVAKSRPPEIKGNFNSGKPYPVCMCAGNKIKCRHICYGAVSIPGTLPGQGKVSPR